MGRPLLEVTGVWKRLCRRPEKALRYALGDIGREFVGRLRRSRLRDGEFWALQDVDFEIEAGEVIGIIGHNGAGKSTLINLVSGVILPTLGTITVHTPRVALIDQSGGLNPIETGRENALTQLALHGVPTAMLAEELRAAEAFAGIGDFIDAPVGTYSLGMRLRLAFSIYSRLKPDLFIIDEAMGGGDHAFRNKFRAYLRDYVDGGGAVLLVSHEMLAIQSFCHTCLLLDHGRVIMTGPPVMMIDNYYELQRERDAEREQAIKAGRSQAEADATRPSCLIESVAVTADDSGDVRPGCAVTIEIAVTVTKEIEGVACGIEIGRGEFMSLATLAGGYPDRPFTLRPPGTTLRCRIERLPLAPGGFDIRVALSQPATATTVAMLGYENSPVAFDVVTQIDECGNLARGRGNVVHIPAEWSMAAATPGDVQME